jgi:hypothetical protein
MVAGDPLALLGLPRFDDLTVDDVLAAAAAVWGWTRDRARGAIDPDRTLAAAAAAGAALARTAAKGGRVAFATGRPASLLGVYAAVARAARVAGAEVVECARAGPFRSRGRADCHLWWVQGVAVLTDGGDLLAASGADDAGTELEFALPRPDLVVADTPFAGAMASAGHRVVACCDLDDLALGVAAARGFPVEPVPLNLRRPPVDYAPVVDAMIGALEAGETPATPDEPPDTG